MTISCPLCGSERTRAVEEARQVEADDGTSLAYTDELTECSKCRERFYTHEQSLASSRVRAAALRTHERLLTPDEIRAIRSRYGLSQAGLEHLLRLGAKTVVRWERGTVCQGRAVDTLLRFLECFGPAAFECVEAGRVGPEDTVVYREPMLEVALTVDRLTAACRMSGAWRNVRDYVTSAEHDLDEPLRSGRAADAIALTM